ncbi:MAG TPA: hypothetical protein VH255_10660 [Verrucomicrobiae bacterium]|nr:hypothetical protein [Verrucomicrobiae bacterium]
MSTFIYNEDGVERFGSEAAKFFHSGHAKKTQLEFYRKTAIDEEMEKPHKSAWLPITPRGVAVFARARVGRLWVFQFIVAFAASLLIAWFVNTAWFSIVRQAILQFPAEGEISDQHLHWADESPQLLAEGHFLAFSVDGKNTAAIRSPAHVQVEFGDHHIRVHSLFGYAEYGYPQGWYPFNRTKLEPVWGAWRPMVLAGLALAVLVGLLMSWVFLATIYSLPVWLVGFFTNRDLDFRASWKLAGAALMPGALFLMVAIFIYAIGLLDAMQLIAGFALHFLIGWVYLFTAPFFLPAASSAAVAKNPFTQPKKS